MTKFMHSQGFNSRIYASNVMFLDLPFLPPPFPSYYIFNSSLSPPCSPRQVHLHHQSYTCYVVSDRLYMLILESIFMLVIYFSTNHILLPTNVHRIADNGDAPV